MAVALILAMIVGKTTAMGEVICNDAVAQLLPCGDFLKNKSAAPSADCCGAVQSLDKVAKLSPDYRKILCECFKNIANSFPINLVKAKQLPKICHASDNVKFDPDVNCDKLIK